MKWIMKYAYWLILTVFLFLFMFYGFLNSDEKGLHFYVTNEESSEKIGIYNSEEGCSYVFLPSYAELEQVTVAFPKSQQFFLNGIELKNGADCGCFSLNQKYEIRIGGCVGSIQFCRSANIPTLYIETSSVSMTALYDDKELEAPVAVTLYSPSGEVEYKDKSCVLKGRGNSTWNAEKKPFLLRLSKEAGLLGMGEDTDWVLLANSYDESNLHNKLILDMADRVCEEWTPKCEYVDIYLNGQYNGLYLLAEKLETGKNRLDIDVNAGEFLCTVDFFVRMDQLENPFYTESGRTIDICEPNTLSAEAKKRITELVNLQEKVLLSQDEVSQQKLVDIDSWLRKYLVDEIVCNTDADLSSSYFYYADGMFYGGPVWDYDMAFGNTIQTRYPKAFIAKNYVKYGQFNSVYYNSLFCTHFARIAELYESDFLPVLSQMINHDIQYTADKIMLAEKMNRIRWPIIEMENPELSPLYRYVNTADSLIQYLKERTEFLNSVLIEKVPYCTVQFEHPKGDFYWTVSVPQGSLLEETDVKNQPLYADVCDQIWIISGTEEIFDPKKPVQKDMVLRRSANCVQN